MTEINGSCLCGKVTATVPKGLPIVLCHCSSCRKTGGAPASWNFVAQSKDFKITGTPRCFQDKGESGHPTYRYFCENCSSVIHTAVSTPDPVFVKVGLFDSKDIDESSEPKSELFCRNMESWLKGYPGAEQKEVQ